MSEGSMRIEVLSVLSFLLDYRSLMGSAGCDRLRVVRLVLVALSRSLSMHAAHGFHDTADLKQQTHRS